MEPYSFMAAIKYNVGSHKGDYYCAGILLDSQWVALPASCVTPAEGETIPYDNPSTYTVQLGSTKLSSGGEEHSVQKIVADPKFDLFVLGHDIALMKLDRATKLAPAKLGKKRSGNAWLASFGRSELGSPDGCWDANGKPLCQSDTLRQLSLKTADSACGNEIAGGEFCMTSTNGQVCDWDGGPVIQKANGATVVPGLMSRFTSSSKICGDYKKDGVSTLVMTDLDSYKSWMTQVIGHSLA